MKFQKFLKSIGSDGIVYNRKTVSIGSLPNGCL